MKKNVIIKPHIFDDRDAIQFELVDGATINDFIKDAKLPVAIHGHIRASINGVPCVRDEFSIPLKLDDNVNIYIVPLGGEGGGKQILRMVAIIAVTVASAGAGASLASFVTGSTVAVGSASAIAGAIAFTAVGILAINALIPPPKLSTGNYASSPASENTYTITGQSNAMSPYGAIPKVYGTHLFFPRLCAQPLVWNSGKSSYMTALYDFGFAELDLTDIRLGVTSIDNFTTRTNYLPSTLGDGLIYFTQLVDLQNIGIELKANNEIVRETALEAKTAEIEILLPRGLVDISDSGAYNNTTVELELAYRLAGSTDSFISRNINAVGAGVIKGILDKTITVLLSRTNPNDTWYPIHSYSLPATNIITVNTNYDIKAGDLISNVVESTGFTFGYGTYSNTGERRTVMQDVSAGNGVEVIIDRPFTNFYRNSADAVDTKYFSTSYDTSSSSSLRITNNTTEGFSTIVRFEFPTVGKYEISVKRITADSTDSQRADLTSWSLLRSFNDDVVLDLDTEHSIFELNLRATEQINGVVENLNAICTSKLRVYDGATFTNEFTNNPAWIVLDVLTGTANAGAIADSQIDFNSFLAFANYCDELITVTPATVSSFTQKRHTANLVVTAETTVADMVQSILSQARGSLKISSNGKYGILYDIAQTLPAQLFTTRNSSNFSSERSYADIPHAVKVKFINPLQNYETDEVIVYSDGYDSITATKFDDVETFGITDYYEAWRHGRYTLAQMIAYQEVFTISVDLEHLSVQRGELVSVQNDVPRIGGIPVRVKEVLNGGLTIVVNDEILHDGISEYHYMVRADNNDIQTGAIDSVADGNIITLAVANPLIQPEDLFVYGFKDFVTKDYIVNSIVPSFDLKATVKLTPYNAGVYTADVGVMPDYDSGIAPELSGDCRVDIQNLTLDYSVEYISRLPVPTFILDWGVSTNATVKGYLIEYASIGINGTDFIVAGTATDSEFIFQLGNLVDNPSLVNADVLFRVTALSITDELCIPSAPLSVKVTPDTTPPADVEFFNVNIVDETLNLTWNEVIGVDISFYVIKFSASLDPLVATWERSVLLTDAISYDTLRHTTNARKGTYLIKAVDTSGNMSATANIAITDIPEIVKLNFIQKLQDSVSWIGEKENFMLEGSEMVTTPVTAEPTCEFTMCDGWWRDGKPWSDTIVWTDVPFDYAGTDYAQLAKYTFNDLVDLSEVYTVRVNVDINAYATRADEIMSNWVKLSDIGSLATTRYDLWNCYIVARTATQISSMSTWAKMSDVIALSDGAGSDWKDEVLTEMGDITGRYFRFYLIAESITEKIRINITDAIINIDMPDRITSKNDIISTVGLNRVNFEPAFYVTPAIGITQDSAVLGDYYTISNKDKTGFDIEFFDAGSNSVVRQFDYMARAYGSLVI